MRHRAHWGGGLLARGAAVAVVVGVGGVATSCSDMTSPTPLSILTMDVGVPASWVLIGTNTASYVLGTDTHSHSGRFALAIGGNDTSSTKFSGVGQLVAADNYRGKRVRLSAWVKQVNIVGTDVGLWMRVDGQDLVYGIDNFSTRTVDGTLDWRQISVILDVPTEATGIAFGALMSGSGEFLVDGMSLDVVPATGSTTNLVTQPLTSGFSDYSTAPKSPANLDFEKQ